MVRTAEAAGATGLVSTRGTVDAFNTKALRASMGSALRLPIATDVRWADLLSICSERGVRVFAAQPRKPGPSPATGSSKAYDRADFKAPFALVFGQEGGGISDHAEGVSDFLVYIPMAKGVESLNVAAAAAILMYEAARQRGFQFTEYGSSRTRPHNAS
jgi:TrmH family RNA methyltransferase